MLAYTSLLGDIRKRNAAFRRRRWFQGRPIHGSGVSDVAWFKPDCTQMTDDDCDVAEGTYDEMVGRIKTRTGEAEDAVRKQLSTF